jgi:signal transduction histidine kinase
MPRHVSSDVNSDAETLLHVMDIGRGLLTELDPDVVLSRILAEARGVTDARYAALGVLHENRSELSRFVTDGIDPADQAAIGAGPRGRGVLGVLIDEPLPLRLADVGAHPQSYGFPAAHPAMASFLGVPIRIRGQVWGNLYLSEKAGGGEFTDVDEQAVIALSEFAATAIQNAEAYQQAEGGRRELLRSVRGLEAARAIADAIGAGVDLDAILELIVKRGRALVGARSVIILLREGDQLVLAAGTGTRGDRRGTRVDIAETQASAALETGQPVRIASALPHLEAARESLGVTDAQAALVIPMVHRGHGIGVLVALDRGAAQEPFSDADEELMGTFASSAANAVAISHSVEADRLRATIQSVEDERRRWARELHDQTLQSLGALRVMLSRAQRRDEFDVFRDTVGQAVVDLEYEIQNLRGIIADLRPPLLDDLGLADALRALTDRQRETGIQAELEVELDGLAASGLILSPGLETTVYRLIQEALTNVVKHARATKVYVRVAVSHSTQNLTLDVIDNGVGFDTKTPHTGFGLGSLRERVQLAGGSINFESGTVGTAIRAQMPLQAEAA